MRIKLHFLQQKKTRKFYNLLINDKDCHLVNCKVKLVLMYQKQSNLNSKTTAKNIYILKNTNLELESVILIII